MGVAMDDVVRRLVAHASFAGKFKHPVRFDGTDFVEQRLTPDEQFAEVAKIASTKMHVFLERYGELLSVEDLVSVSASPLAEAEEVRFWLARLRRDPPSDNEKQKRSRRRRWLWARREMGAAEGFFSEDEMKRRDPKLFHKLVGRHLDSGARLSQPMQGSLSGYLMQRLEKESEDELRGTSAGARAGTGAGVAAPAEPSADADGVPRAKRHKGDLHAGGEGPDEGEEEDGADADFGEFDGEGAASEQDPALRRAQFLKAMRERFVNGLEPGFDYAQLDEDSDLDDIVELGRDAEDKYFADE